jgi:hypothetical protein
MPDSFEQLKVILVEELLQRCPDLTVEAFASNIQVATPRVTRLFWFDPDGVTFIGHQHSCKILFTDLTVDKMVEALVTDGTTMTCSLCRKDIDPERLEALPHTRLCIACARENPEPPRHDPNVECAQASPSGQNGFAPKS